MSSKNQMEILKVISMDEELRTATGLIRYGLANLQKSGLGMSFSIYRFCFYQADLSGSVNVLSHSLTLKLITLFQKRTILKSMDITSKTQFRALLQIRIQMII